ncbi:cytochrome P450 [Phycomyces nitens]|nr:cytochrome P450 [Phycomyces nitens]
MEHSIEAFKAIRLQEVLQLTHQHWNGLIGIAEKYIDQRVLSPLGINASVKRVLTGLGLAGYVGYIISKYFIYRLYLNPINKIPGPPVSWVPFTGNAIEIIKDESGVPHKRWTKKYGGIVAYHGPWNNCRVLVTDPGLIREILTIHEYDYIKTEQTSDFLRKFIGNGLLVAEGPEHKKQRRMLNPAFSVNTIRSITPLMAIPAIHLYNKWKTALKDIDSIEYDISHELSLATLDVIAIAGFGEEFEAVKLADTPQSNKLGDAYMSIFSAETGIMRILSFFFPILNKLPTERNLKTKSNLRTLQVESEALVERGKMRTKDSGSNNSKDILSLMIKEVDDEGKGMDIHELQNQCLTFLAAGHETTSVALSWCLWLLAQNPQIQDELREEIRPLFKQIETDHPLFSNPKESRKMSMENQANVPSYDAINNLKLLNNVCKETMRVIPPVPVTNRVAQKEAVLGNHLIPKGTNVFISIISNHHSKEIWGDDAEEFRPSRWDEELAKKVSPYEYMPFLAGGRQCIGYKFALIEMKILLAIMIMDFKFYEKPGFHPAKKQMITLRPVPNMTLILKKAE